MTTETYKRIINFYDIEQKLKDTTHDLLRKAGWEYTCNTPGSYWVWKKEFEGYGLMMGSTDMALKMEESSQALNPANWPKEGEDDGR